ncbi:MAG TPA: serine protease, partial [Rhodanobacteraceae bacterium]|nr:serine protease [Rhodanobacteraceae bacterium]
MKAGALLIAAACLAWVACAHAQTGNAVVAMDSHRDIVLAVANPIDPPPTHAGSSLLGYAPSGNYGAGQRAVSLLATLQQRYRWRQLV